MAEPEPAAESGRLAAARGRFGAAVRLSEPFARNPPLWIEPVDRRLAGDLATAQGWMAEHRAAIEQALIGFGAILWRGFPVTGSDAFAALMAGFDAFAQGYAGGTSDRKTITGQVMEATRTAPDTYIPLHQEMSYMPVSPRLLAFFCRQPAQAGGETVICDMRGLLQELPEPLRDRIARCEVDYVRNMRSEWVADWRADPQYRHPSWQYRFETEDPAAVEAQLRARGADFAWQTDGSLTFWTRVPGVTTHPVTGELLYFNQINSQVQHRLTIGEARAARVEAAYGATVPRPYSVRFGDGQAVSEADFLTIHAAFERRKIAFEWQAGDVLLIENKLTAHGRNPFSGPRDVQVMLFQ